MLKIYNTLSNALEEFKPITSGKVNMYVCGPTVNDVPHLGHARMQVNFDVLRKYLKFAGYDVNFVSNVTDIEDKIINKAKDLGVSIKDLTESNLKEHLDDYAAIGVDKPDIQPRATEYVEEMIDLVKRLSDKGFAYIVPEDGVYYDVSKFENYGKLSGVDLTQLRSARELKDESKGQGKRDNKDFVLWKFSKEGEPAWDSPFGPGRPGWHIECSAMSHSILGLPLDLHCGGQDLIFPHHEDEIAQSEAGYGLKFCNYWMHNGMVNIDKIKMSKSLGNFTTIKDLLRQYSGEVIRYFVISAHYRKPIDFSMDKLTEAKTSYDRLRGLIQNIEDDGKINEEAIVKFKKAMDDDLNTAGALNVLWKLVRSGNEGIIGAVREMDKVFSLKLLEKDEVELSSDILKLLEIRKKAREDKDFALSDKLREDITELGYILKDSKEGQRVSKI